MWIKQILDLPSNDPGYSPSSIPNRFLTLNPHHRDNTEMRFFDVILNRNNSNVWIHSENIGWIEMMKKCKSNNKIKAFEKNTSRRLKVEKSILISLNLYWTLIKSYIHRGRSYTSLHKQSPFMITWLTHPSPHLPWLASLNIRDQDKRHQVSFSWLVWSSRNWGA